jgi:uncharacterized YigZ family protein
MEGYFSPAGAGGAEFTEKRSRFIGRVVPVDSEDAAREEIARVKAERHDARHNCSCYIVRGGPERYSDDGEPQGTAGQPMLEVLRHGGIQNACCIVTRYFGGILLGPGGLSRAYTAAATLALANAGLVEFCLRDCMEIICAYSFLERAKKSIAGFGGIVERIEYGEHAILSVLTPKGQAAAINKQLADLSAGTVAGVVTGSRWAAGSP